VRFRLLAFVVAAACGGALAFACGIDVRGAAGAPSADATVDAGEAGTEGHVVDPGGDSDASVGFAGDASCAPTKIDDPLTTIDSKWIVQEKNNSNRPAVISSGDSKIVSMIGGDRDDARGALFLANPVPTRAFDVQFKFAVDCGLYWWSGCADGMAAVWLDVSALGGGALAGAVANAGTGSTFGIPNGLTGAGVGIDIHQNPGDPSTPAIEILSIDGTRALGSYPWIVKSTSDKYDGAVAHTMRLSLRAGLLTATLDGKPLVSGVATTPTTSSAFGFTAATGGENGVFYVWDFHAAFFSCDP
jgi:hypothetical protein